MEKPLVFIAAFSNYINSNTLTGYTEVAQSQTYLPLSLITSRAPLTVGVEGWVELSIVPLPWFSLAGLATSSTLFR